LNRERTFQQEEGDGVKEVTKLGEGGKGEEDGFWRRRKRRRLRTDRISL
jgi:hypothetical protein